jgi:hypothetical protein
MLIGDKKYKKVIKKNYMNSNNIMLLCSVTYQTRPSFRKEQRKKKTVIIVDFLSFYT